VKGVRFFFFLPDNREKQATCRPIRERVRRQKAPGAADDRAKEKRLGFSPDFGFVGILSLAPE
jgi:hypothetical protein